MDLIASIIYCTGLIVFLRAVVIKERRRKSQERIERSRQRLQKEIEAAGERVSLDLWRYNIGKSDREPLRKACGYFSNDEAQKLLKK